MLRHLRVTNFAILSDVAMDLTPGFNVLTGETGAGKSLIVEAVNLLRGGRASADIPRAGTDQATVEAIFEVPEDIAGRVRQVLAQAGLSGSDSERPDSGASDDGGAGDGGAGGASGNGHGARPASPLEVLVRRVIHRGGRSRTYVNGALTTARRLAELGSWLVDLSGQHQHQGLVDPRRHRDILDAFGNAQDQVERMRTACAVLRQAEAAIAALGGDEGALQDKLDYLGFQLDELDSAAIVAGEDAALEQERSRLQSADKLETGARAAEGLLYAGDRAAVDVLASAQREVERLVAIDPGLADIVRQVEEARVLAEEAAASLRRYADSVDGDAERLTWVDDRLAALARLKRKHGGTLDAVLARAEALRAELDTLARRDERLAELERDRDRAASAAQGVAAELTAVRQGAAATLTRAVATYLAELEMASARLTVKLDSRDLGPDGADRVEFVLASNQGEEAKPLARIASGGELSRIMLSLKLSLRRADEVATYVFDEVDTGIGGAMAEVVGRQIRALADQRQVLCVTHLPQIAAFADSHFHVAKLAANGRTETSVRALGVRERRAEVARMLGGVKIGKSARAHADAMLEAAAKGRGKAPLRSRA